MAFSDFANFEAGDTLSILRNESSIMTDLFSYNLNHEGDFTKHVDEAWCEQQSTELKLKNLDHQNVGSQIKSQEKENKIRHRRVHSDGGISFKKIHSSSIMSALQMGIQRSVGSLRVKPERDILMADFMTVESASLAVNVKTQSSEFIFKTYAPEAFRHFRHLFGIDPDKFVSSFCEAPLVELPNPGASGSVFYLTYNDQFITKTVQHREAEFLQKLLPGYYLNLNQNPLTVLPKFFGLYCCKSGTKNVRMVVMNNVLPTSVKIHQKYDLKGSTHNRVASKIECQQQSPTFKDLDFISHHPEGIFLDNEAYDSLLKTIQRDCRVLESFQIMDYSLLLGVHNIEQGKRERLENVGTNKEYTTEVENVKALPSGDGNSSDDARKTKEIRNECILCSKLVLKNVGKKGGELCTDMFSGLPAIQANGEKLLLFIGIIDILQSYRLRKKVEHALKSVIYEGATVSVSNPGFYSQRFQQFISNSVFKCISSPLRNKKKTLNTPKTSSIKTNL